MDAPFRLPETVAPVGYRLDLEIVPDDDRFGGVVEIDVRITSPTDVIWLHGRDLDVTEVALRSSNGESSAGRYEQVTDDGMARVIFPRRLEPQSATLRFEYRVAFNSSLYGLYKVTVGQDHYAYTQFQSIWARTAFPGFDEPRFKTPFDITITTRDGHRAFTNTRAVSQQRLDGNRQRFRYATTLPLPTYLIAFAVGPLDVVEWEPVPPSVVREQPLQLRGIVTRGRGEQMRYALSHTSRMLLSLEAYFGTAYPYDKLDIVAVPDFGAGAMENAGLITYREPLVLLGDAPGVNQVRWYALIHAHELAHQWFGNLVTMPWWDDIWLNESFASWIQALIGHQWDPSYNFDRSTQARAIGAMREDSLVVARQIREPVNSTADILNAFDGITYQKGAGVLQMVEHYLGADVFRDALRRHMQTYAFGVADVFDLIKSLSDVAGEDKRVADIFESFLFQRGVPYVRVQKVCDESEPPALRVSQRRFLPVGSAGDPQQTWSIPLCFAYGNDDKRHDQCNVVSDAVASVEIDAGVCPDWVMPNADGAGYYRWRLEDDDFAALRDVFGARLSARERISFVDSLVAGLESGDVPMTAFFDILPTILAARERAVVEASLDTLRRVAEMFDGADGLQAREYIADLIKARLDRVSEPGGAESASEAALLTARLTRFLAIDLRDAQTRDYLRSAAIRSLGYPAGQDPDPNALPPDLLRPALIVAVQEEGVAFINFLLERFDADASSRFRLAVMEALALADDPNAAKQAQAFVLNPRVRGNELDRWLDYSVKPDAYPYNWPWLQDNLDLVLAEGASRLAREAPYAMGRWLCSREDAKTLESMFRARLDAHPGMGRNLQRALEQVDLCMAYRKTHAQSVASLLD